MSRLVMFIIFLFLLERSNFSKTCLQELMRLPNLSNLHITLMKMNLTKQVTTLKNLVLGPSKINKLDTDDLVKGLALMPNLSSCGTQTILTTCHL